MKLFEREQSHSRWTLYFHDTNRINPQEHKRSYKMLFLFASCWHISKAICLSRAHHTYAECDKSRANDKANPICMVLFEMRVSVGYHLIVTRIVVKIYYWFILHVCASILDEYDSRAQIQAKWLANSHNRLWRINKYSSEFVYNSSKFYPPTLCRRNLVQNIIYGAHTFCVILDNLPESKFHCH